ncbi:hypothetical protein P7K49_022456 [Saguinus oedipus]|uniref:Uncharacterized protein n=1 Tax=Saguinus oedipus TaxID=9490 RepID=A0ABQ9UX91_SAGOE|nr:hypothetical protein P7K49_022456 [Saguinus oedipus]
MRPSAGLQLRSSGAPPPGGWRWAVPDAEAGPGSPRLEGDGKERGQMEQSALLTWGRRGQDGWSHWVRCPAWPLRASIRVGGKRGPGSGRAGLSGREAGKEGRPEEGPEAGGLTLPARERPRPAAPPLAAHRTRPLERRAVRPAPPPCREPPAPRWAPAVRAAQR